jgi:ubiquitin-protein ligase
MNKLEDKYFELNLQLSEYYPFVPPKVSYVKPRINLNLAIIYQKEILKWKISKN